MTPPFVVVAMSGGVDSSVGAGLLVEQGYRVVGMMLRLWSETGQEEKNRCCTPDSVAQARRVAAILDIPLYVIDARELFRQIVVEAFITGYRRGETPNPCVICNQVIRWGFLLKQAQEIGAEWLATGHYARLRQESNGIFQLLKGKDSQKDQSYVLSRLTQAQLTSSLFPLGEMTKNEVRNHARRLDLPVSERADSQDLCFLAEGDYRPFLQRHAPEILIPGPIINTDGAVIGVHQGLAFYTIGQRKGLGIAASHPLYVIEKDLEKNSLIIGEEHHLGRRDFSVENMNWISGRIPTTPVQVDVKIRYLAQPASAIVTPQVDGSALVKTDHLLRDVTPGQLAVFYEQENVLGSGFIRIEEQR